MRHFIVSVAALATLGAAGALTNTTSAQASTDAAGHCPARESLVADTRVQWYAPPSEDAAALGAWCRGVGAPLIEATPGTGSRDVPSLDELVVVSWNAHLADGRLTDLITDLRRGTLTGGRPVEHFVLLLQELYRRGSDVPAFESDARSAFAILPRNPQAPDARDYAQQLGLAMAYVPSMRNGAEMREDRGNAIISTEPLHDLFALELPLERQRRVAAGAAIVVRTGAEMERVQVVDTHLEPLAAPSSLWVLRNPRRRQVNALLDLFRQPRFESGAGTVVGGDFNTVQGGAREEAYRRVRAWSHSLEREDARSTHLLGRLDYVFARLSPGWRMSTVRITERYGSDHHPVMAQFHRPSSESSGPKMMR